MSRYPIEQLCQNIIVIINKYFAIYNKIISKQTNSPQLFHDPLQLNKLFFKFFNKIMSDPDRIIEYQISFFKSQLETIENIFNKFSHHSNQSEQLTNKDKRFSNNLWHEHCAFAWLRESYFTYTKWIKDIIAHSPDDDFTKIEFRRLNFVITQFLDALSPSNFPLSNPEVLQAFFDSAGKNFINGLDNLLSDLERSKYGLQIQNTDNESFSLGVNVANTEGAVVYQNDIIQLIHYKAIHNQHYSIPILIVSPFINKYYIMDLQSETSFVRWLVENNYNVFMISWVNPDESLFNENFADYMLKGPIAALDYITKTLNVSKVNTVGYCIGGTLLSCAIAYLKAHNDHRVNSATLLTTLIDFEEAGDLSIFIDDNFIEEVANHMKSSGGYLDGEDMYSAFNLLRSNDMIWPFYINNYLLGKEPFPFNLLYWNSDPIRIPMELHLFYLKAMYKDNLLKTPRGVELNNQPIDISSIDIPCFIVAAKNDHIVPWKNAFNSAKLFSGDVVFTLTDSGHVAGIINHPNQNKYCYWHNKFNNNSEHEEWLETANMEQGSWWLHWQKWLQKHSGDLIASKDLKAIHPNIIENAPGSYVKTRY